MSAESAHVKRFRIRAIPTAIAALHFLVCIIVANTPAEGSWQWFPMFVIDFPASMLPLLLGHVSVPPLLSFGVVGSVWWYFIACVIGWFVNKGGHRNAA